MKTQIYLLITLTFLISLTSCVVKIMNVDDPASARVDTTTLQTIIESGNLSKVASSTDPLVTNTLTYLTAKENYSTSTKVKAIYATESGSGDFSGTSWTNAVAATNLQKTINDISDASATNVYAVLVAGGTYKPVTTTMVTTAKRRISFTMKNHVAIIGGFAASGGWERTGTTTFSGAIGTTTDNSYQVFSHNGIPLDNALLYGATITKGNANANNASDIPRRTYGGGMYNEGSSPMLIDVRFVNNSASIYGGGMYNGGGSSSRLVNVRFTGNEGNRGGGMYNSSSSPVLRGVVFAGNSALIGGGGMFNLSSSPVLTGVVFSSNKSTSFDDSGSAIGGGGMFNASSSPVLRGVVFVGNSANVDGGGMFNANLSSPVLVGTIFRGNTAKNNGGGMYTYFVRSGDGPVIVNSIFADNSATTGADILLDRKSSGTNISVRVAGSVLGVGKANATNGIVVITSDTNSTAGSYNITYHSLKNDAVNFGDNKTTDTATGGLTYPTIQNTSSVLNIGLYVRRKVVGSVITYYFSEDGTNWYTGFLSTGGLDLNKRFKLPPDPEDLTSTDIAGNARNGRPDAGVHEYK